MGARVRGLHGETAQHARLKELAGKFSKRACARTTRICAMAIRSFLSLIHKISSRSATGVTLACCATCARCKTSSTIAPSSKNCFATAARTCFFLCCPSNYFVTRRCPSAGARSWNQMARSHSPAGQSGTTLQKKIAFAFCTELPSPEHDSQIGIPKASATARFRTNKRLISA